MSSPPACNTYNEYFKEYSAQFCFFTDGEIETTNIFILGVSSLTLMLIVYFMYIACLKKSKMVKPDPFVLYDETYCSISYL